MHCHEQTVTSKLIQTIYQTKQQIGNSHTEEAAGRMDPRTRFQCPSTDKATQTHYQGMGELLNSIEK